MFPNDHRRSWKDLERYCEDLLSSLVLVELIATKNKSDAAESLRISHEKIAGKLEKLEKLLGVGKGEIVTLGKPARLTPLGIEVRNLWRQIEPLLVNFREKAARIKDPCELRVKVVKSVYDAENDWMKTGFAELMKAFGKSEISLSLMPVVPGHADDIQPLLLSNEADIAIGYAPETLDESLEKRFWREEELRLVVRKNRAETVRRRNPEIVWNGITARQICRMEHPICMMQAHQPLRIQVLDFLAAGRVTLGQDIPEKQVREVKAALDQVVEDAAISILPVGSIQRAVKADLVEAFRLSPALFRTMIILTHKDVLRQKQEAVIAFRDLLVQHDQPLPTA